MKFLCIVINYGAGISRMVIGGVTGALRGGVAVNINDTLHVRGEGRPAGPTNQPAGDRRADGK